MNDRHIADTLRSLDRLATDTDAAVPEQIAAHLRLAPMTDEAPALLARQRALHTLPSVPRAALAS
jgi:hypothetical protein